MAALASLRQAAHRFRHSLKLRLLALFLLLTRSSHLTQPRLGSRSLLRQQLLLHLEGSHSAGGGCQALRCLRLFTLHCRNGGAERGRGLL